MVKGLTFVPQDVPSVPFSGCVGFLGVAVDRGLSRCVFMPLTTSLVAGDEAGCYLPTKNRVLVSGTIRVSRPFYYTALLCGYRCTSFGFLLPRGMLKEK